MEKKIINEIKTIKLMMNSINGNKINILESYPIDTDIDEALGDTIAKDLENIHDLSSVGGTLRSAFEDMERAIMNSPEGAIKIGTKELKTADEIFTAIKDGSLKGKELGRVEKGLLKSRNTPFSLRKTIISDFTKNKNILKDLSDHCKNTKDIKIYLDGKGYAPESINGIISDLKSKNYIGDKGVFTYEVGSSTKVSTGTNTSNISGVKKYTQDQFQKLKDFFKGGKRSWKETLIWAAGIGIGATALWYMLSDSGQKPDDMPTTPPTDSNWAPCIQKLINDKIGIVATSPSGEVSVKVTNEQYPKGIQFYSGGRVFDIATGKKGTYNCKNGQIVSEQASSNNSGLYGDVNIMIDLLDFPCTTNDLRKAKALLQKYVSNGQGQRFLDLYQDSGLGGGDLNKSLKYLYVTEPESVDNRNQMYSMIKQIQSGQSSSNQGSGNGLNDINIIWDGENSGGGNSGGGSSKGSGVKYHDCNGQPFPLEYGCISDKVKDIQGCLGITPTKGYFGPKTKGVINANVIEKDTYDKIMSKCNPSGSTTATTSPTTATTITNKVPDNTITGPGENPEIDNTTKFGDKGTDPATGKPATWDGTKWVEDVDQNQGKQLYDSLIQQGKLKIENNMFANRIKEKGDLTTDQLNMIDSYLLPLGYTRFKQKLDKSYGVKYVWRKK